MLRCSGLARPDGSVDLELALVFAVQRASAASLQPADRLIGGSGAAPPGPPSPGSPCAPGGGAARDHLVVRPSPDPLQVWW